MTPSHSIDDQVWSPDGQKIACASNRGDDAAWDIWVMQPDGIDLRRLTNTPAQERSLAWSPDGAWLAFDADFEGSAVIYVMRADGTELTPLINGTLPAWRP